MTSVRIDTPAFHRNCIYILEILKKELGQGRGNILEVASGSGQHCLEFARELPDYVFWPSDINSDHMESIEEWQKTENTKNLRSPIKLDVVDFDWHLDIFISPEIMFEAIINVNMVHIAPIEAAEGLFRGSGQYLKKGGKLILYGPFKKNGRHVAQSNQQFDDALRAKNYEWGVRDISELSAFGKSYNLKFSHLVPMPSNNFMLIYCRI
ncbi:MAG: DUF938 domain-containing protein [Pseudomonadota bacterium]|nr:DUF938 domain-containing protein [Pseudomonadota bacterium]